MSSAVFKMPGTVATPGVGGAFGATLAPVADGYVHAMASGANTSFTGPVLELTPVPPPRATALVAAAVLAVPACRRGQSR